ncbi:uncharacterized protein LOC121389750 [Gigantopelta aegis]|uniref:uncharacterized protein LOC121389750 n=1 Tax=Gigantopelta aegis TaxID=1735272 RepID=UPI001B88D0FE|nr:uncharacterized protein LOC121389750 [Gigantopelta aegis]
MSKQSSGKPTPRHMITPPGIQLNPSMVHKGALGVYCTVPIAESQLFGPFAGEVILEGDDEEVNYRFAWEVYDQKTNKLLHIINATKPRSGNWMRYVNCARFFEEQNIVSVQNGCEIFYKAIRPISAGEELLTWYAPFRGQSKRQGNRRKPVVLDDSGVKETKKIKKKGKSDEHFDEKMKSLLLYKYLTKDGKMNKLKTEKKPKVSTESDHNELNTEKSETKTTSDRKPSEKVQKAKANVSMTSDTEVTPRSKVTGHTSWLTPDMILHSEHSPDKVYQFVIRNEHKVKTKNGGTMYACDICGAPYNRMFSLKRHVIRQHINAKYLTLADITNCMVNVVQQEKNVQVKCNLKKTRKAKSIPSSGDLDMPGLYRCFVCATLFDAAEELRKHECDKKYTSKLHCCPVCPLKFILKIDLTRHTISHTEGIDTPFPCKICGKSFMSSTSMKKHTQFHSGNNFSCKVCPSRFSSITELLKHTSNKHIHSASKQSVGILKKSVMKSSKSKFKMHNKQKTEAEMNSAVVVVDAIVVDEASIKPTAAATTAATAKSRKKKNRKMKLMQHSSKPFDKNSVSVDKPFSCQVCGKAFPNEARLKMHESYHKDRVYTCRFCSVKHVKLACYRKHLQRVHPESLQNGVLIRDANGDKQQRTSSVQVKQANITSVPAQQMSPVLPDKQDAEEEEKNVMKKCPVECDDTAVESFLPNHDSEETGEVELWEGEIKSPKSGKRSRFNFACTVCKKKFNCYVNMCRHRRLAHRTRKYGQPTLLCQREAAKLRDTVIVSDYIPIPPEMNYANVAENIATNLNHYLDGGQDAIASCHKYIKTLGTNSCLKSRGEMPGTVTWTKFNFPSSFQPWEGVVGYDIDEELLKVYDDLDIDKPAKGRNIRRKCRGANPEESCSENSSDVKNSRVANFEADGSVDNVPNMKVDKSVCESLEKENPSNTEAKSATEWIPSAIVKFQDNMEDCAMRADAAAKQNAQTTTSTKTEPPVISESEISGEQALVSGCLDLISKKNDVIEDDDIHKNESKGHQCEVTVLSDEETARDGDQRSVSKSVQPVKVEDLDEDVKAVAKCEGGEVTLRKASEETARDGDQRSVPKSVKVEDEEVKAVTKCEGGEVTVWKASEAAIDLDDLPSESESKTSVIVKNKEVKETFNAELVKIEENIKSTACQNDDASSSEFLVMSKDICEAASMEPLDNSQTENIFFRQNSDGPPLLMPAMVRNDRRHSSGDSSDEGSFGSPPPLLSPKELDDELQSQSDRNQECLDTKQKDVEFDKEKGSNVRILAEKENEQLPLDLTSGDQPSLSNEQCYLISSMNRSQDSSLQPRQSSGNTANDTVNNHFELEGSAKENLAADTFIKFCEQEETSTRTYPCDSTDNGDFNSKQNLNRHLFLDNHIQNHSTKEKQYDSGDKDNIAKNPFVPTQIVKKQSDCFIASAILAGYARKSTNDQSKMDNICESINMNQTVETESSAEYRTKDISLVTKSKDTILPNDNNDSRCIMPKDTSANSDSPTTTDNTITTKSKDTILPNDNHDSRCIMPKDTSVNSDSPTTTDNTITTKSKDTILPNDNHDSVCMMRKDASVNSDSLTTTDNTITTKSKDTILPNDNNDSLCIMPKDTSANSDSLTTTDNTITIKSKDTILPNDNNDSLCIMRKDTSANSDSPTTTDNTITTKSKDTILPNDNNDSLCIMPKDTSANSDSLTTTDNTITTKSKDTILPNDNNDSLCIMRKDTSANSESPTTTDNTITTKSKDTILPNDNNDSLCIMRKDTSANSESPTTTDNTITTEGKDTSANSDSLTATDNTITTEGKDTSANSDSLTATDNTITTEGKDTSANSDSLTATDNTITTEGKDTSANSDSLTTTDNTITTEGKDTSANSDSLTTTDNTITTEGKDTSANSDSLTTTDNTITTKGTSSDCSVTAMKDDTFSVVNQNSQEIRVSEQNNKQRCQGYKLHSHPVIKKKSKMSKAINLEKIVEKMKATESHTERKDIKTTKEPSMNGSNFVCSKNVCSMQSENDGAVVSRVNEVEYLFKHCDCQEKDALEVSSQTVDKILADAEKSNSVNNHEVKHDVDMISKCPDHDKFKQSKIYEDDTTKNTTCEKLFDHVTVLDRDTKVADQNRDSKEHEIMAIRNDEGLSSSVVKDENVFDKPFEKVIEINNLTNSDGLLEQNKLEVTSKTTKCVLKKNELDFVDFSNENNTWKPSDNNNHNDDCRNHLKKEATLSLEHEQNNLFPDSTKMIPQIPSLESDDKVPNASNRCTCGSDTKMDTTREAKLGFKNSSNRDSVCLLVDCHKILTSSVISDKNEPCRKSLTDSDNQNCADDVVTPLSDDSNTHNKNVVALTLENLPNELKCQNFESNSVISMIFSEKNLQSQFPPSKENNVAVPVPESPTGSLSEDSNELVRKNSEAKNARTTQSENSELETNARQASDTHSILLKHNCSKQPEEEMSRSKNIFKVDEDHSTSSEFVNIDSGPSFSDAKELDCLSASTFSSEKKVFESSNKLCDNPFESSTINNSSLIEKATESSIIQNDVLLEKTSHTSSLLESSTIEKDLPLETVGSSEHSIMNSDVSVKMSNMNPASSESSIIHKDVFVKETYGSSCSLEYSAIHKNLPLEKNNSLIHEDLPVRDLLAMTDEFSGSPKSSVIHKDPAIKKINDMSSSSESSIIHTDSLVKGLPVESSNKLSSPSESIIIDSDLPADKSSESSSSFESHTLDKDLPLDETSEPGESEHNEKLCNKSISFETKTSNSIPINLHQNKNIDSLASNKVTSNKVTATGNSRISLSIDKLPESIGDCKDKLPQSVGNSQCKLPDSIDGDSQKLADSIDGDSQEKLSDSIDGDSQKKLSDSIDGDSQKLADSIDGDSQKKLYDYIDGDSQKKLPDSIDGDSQNKLNNSIDGDSLKSHASEGDSVKDKVDQLSDNEHTMCGLADPPSLGDSNSSLVPRGDPSTSGVIHLSGKCDASANDNLVENNPSKDCHEHDMAVGEKTCCNSCLLETLKECTFARTELSDLDCKVGSNMENIQSIDLVENVDAMSKPVPDELQFERVNLLKNLYLQQNGTANSSTEADIVTNDDSVSGLESASILSTSNMFRHFLRPTEDPLQNYEHVMFGKQGKIVCVCAICRRQFLSVDLLLRHHWKKHPSIDFKFIEVEQGSDVDLLYFPWPCNFGLLASALPIAEDYRSLGIYKCTRCASKFKNINRLHVHIINCDPNREPVIPNSKKKRIQKRMRAKMVEFKEKEAQVQNNLNSMLTDSSQREAKHEPRGFTGCRKRRMIRNNVDAVIKIRKKRNYELLYNPHNHVRRREMISLLDTHQCSGCKAKFKTLHLLERHATKCSNKETLQSLKPVQNKFIDEVTQKRRHICHYCSKHFIYLKSLANHYRAFCPVRKEKRRNGQITDDDLDHEKQARTQLESQEQEVEQDKTDGKKRKGGWPKGMKRKKGRKKRTWTIVKRRKPSSPESEGAHEIISSPLWNLDLYQDYSEVLATDEPKEEEVNKSQTDMDKDDDDVSKMQSSTNITVSDMQETPEQKNVTLKKSASKAKGSNMKKNLQESTKKVSRGTGKSPGLSATRKLYTEDKLSAEDNTSSEVGAKSKDPTHEPLIGNKKKQKIVKSKPVKKVKQIGSLLNSELPEKKKRLGNKSASSLKIKKEKYRNGNEDKLEDKVDTLPLVNAPDSITEPLSAGAGKKSLSKGHGNLPKVENNYLDTADDTSEEMLLKKTKNKTISKKKTADKLHCTKNILKKSKNARGGIQKMVDCFVEEGIVSVKTLKKTLGTKTKQIKSVPKKKASSDMTQKPDPSNSSIHELPVIIAKNKNTSVVKIFKVDTSNELFAKKGQKKRLKVLSQSTPTVIKSISRKKSPVVNKSKKKILQLKDNLLEIVGDELAEDKEGSFSNGSNMGDSLLQKCDKTSDQTATSACSETKLVLTSKFACKTASRTKLSPCSKARLASGKQKGKPSPRTAVPANMLCGSVLSVTPETQSIASPQKSPKKLASGAKCTISETLDEVASNWQGKPTGKSPNSPKCKAIKRLFQDRRSRSPSPNINIDTVFKKRKPNSVSKVQNKSFVNSRGLAVKQKSPQKTSPVRARKMKNIHI